MSEIIATLNDGLVLPPDLQAEKDAKAAEEAKEAADEAAAKQLPQPKGWKILCALIEVADKYESGLAKADQTVKTEELTSPVLFVLELGDIAYQDKDKFPTGPWCKKGDFVITRPYTGTRVMIHGKEFRLINDDQVDAVVEDPRGIFRA